MSTQEIPKGVFTEEQVAVFKALQDRAIQPQDEDLPTGFPFVTEKVADQMSQTLNIPPYDKYVQYQSTKYFPELTHPFYRALQIAEDMFSQFTTDNRTGLTDRVKEWAEKKFGQGDAVCNSAVAGAAVVLKTFHVMLGPDFIDAVKKIPPKAMIESFADRNSFVDEVTLIGITANRKMIPEHQNFLKSMVNQFILYAPYETGVEAGAFRMYSFLEDNWRYIGPELQGKPDTI